MNHHALFEDTLYIEEVDEALNGSIHKGRVVISDIPVDIYAHEDIGFAPKDYGIPSLTFTEAVPSEFGGSVYYVESDIPELVWDVETLRFYVFGPKTEIYTCQPLIYAALTVSEYLRQRSGQVLTHGAAVETENGQGLLILGNQGSGKTTLAINLCQRGAKLIGNDQVYFGDGQNIGVPGMHLLDGTKNIMLRESATKNKFLQNHASRFTPSENAWDNKISLCPSELGIQVAEKPTPLDSVILLHLSTHETDKTGIKKLSKGDLGSQLFLAEKLSRHITGIATPLLSDNLNLLALSPSLDDHFTLANRNKLIDELYEIGVYKVWGGNVEEISDMLEMGMIDY